LELRWFFLGTAAGVNANTDNFVSWNWKANGSGVSNTDGYITSTVSANTTSGMSIVQYSGNGCWYNNWTRIRSSTKMCIIKRTDTTSNWIFGTCKRI
jgi:hypothetical protein